MLREIVKYKSFQIILFSITLLFSLSNNLYADVITVKCLGGGDYTNISDAIEFAFSGDIVEVYPCRYEEAVVIDKNLTLKGMGPQKVIIDSPGVGITVDVNRNATISGFYITAAASGISLTQDTNTVITNNCIVSCGGAGIHVCGASIYTAIATITNNTIAYCGGSGIRQACSNSNTSYIRNNIFYRNSTCGIDRTNGSVVLSYNNVYQNGTDYCNTVAHATDISLNPLFLSPPINSCILQSNSLCVNAGSPGIGNFDPDGSQNDIGTYGGPSCASFWPYPPGAPIITDLNASPTSVPKGSLITIEATGEVYE